MQPIDPDQWLKQYGAKIEQAKQHAEQAVDQLGGVGGSASSPDGLITVTVNATGVLTDLADQAGGPRHGPQRDRHRGAHRLHQGPA